MPRLLAFPSAAALAACLLAAAPAPAAETNPNPSFNAINRATTAITELYATPAGRTGFGRSRLDGKRLEPGASFAVRLPADGNCIYDIRAVFADGHHEDRRDQNTCKVEDIVLNGSGSAAATPRAGSTDPSFRLVNRARQPVAEFYATPAGRTNWGQNRLSEALPPGATRMIRIPADGNCVFDLRVVFADHKSREKKGDNLCRITDLPVQ
jgi:hypothetical protein